MSLSLSTEGEAIVKAFLKKAFETPAIESEIMKLLSEHSPADQTEILRNLVSVTGIHSSFWSNRLREYLASK